MKKKSSHFYTFGFFSKILLKNQNFINIVIIVLIINACNVSPLEIHVSDYGAIPNDDIDDSKSIQTALLDAKEKGAKVVYFEAGVYNFKGLPGWNTSERGNRSNYVTIDDITDLEMVGTVDKDGSPTTYFVKDNDLKEGQPMIMSINGGTNIRLRNIVVDMSPYYYSAGKVLKINGDEVEIEVLQGHPVINGQKAYIMGIYDLETKKAKTVRITWDSNLPQWYTTGDNENRLMKMSYKPLAESCKVGEAVFWFQGNYSGAMIGLRNINDIMLENIHILNGHGFPITNNNCNNITYRNVSIKPVGNRIATVCRDGFKIYAGSGKVVMDKVHVEGCLGDDGQNIHGTWLSVIHRRSNKELTVSSRRVNLTPGKDVVLLDDNFKPVWRSKLVKSISEDSVTVITFADDIPSWVHERTPIEPQEWLPDSMIITNCVYRSTGRFGVLLKASNTLIENTLFENNVAGIHIGGEWSWGYWLESTNPQNIEIRNCTFRDNRLDLRFGGKKMDMAISIASWTNPDKLGEPSDTHIGLMRDIRIHDNIFENERICVSIQNCMDVWFWNNTLINCEVDLEVDQKTTKNINRTSK